MLIAIWFSANSVKGKAALQLSREIGVQYKTARVLLMKLREAIAWRREEMVLDGEVEIDGKYAGGHIRPENKAEDRIDRRLKKYQNMKRLCALAIRQRGLGGQTFTPCRRGSPRLNPSAIRKAAGRISKPPTNTLTVDTSARERWAMAARWPPKGQHFLLSPECRTLTVLDLAKMAGCDCLQLV
jgi:hypothetical protein